MRIHRIIVPLLILAIAAFVASVAASTYAQNGTFTDPNVDYTFELPSSTWRVVSRPDSMHGSAELVFGDRLDGYLQVRREVVDAGMSLSELADRDKDQKLSFRPGYVNGKQEQFVGQMNGIVVSYEYTNSGKPMLGRIYYLQADNRTVYVLHFTGSREKLNIIRSQTDSIARTFRLK